MQDLKNQVSRKKSANNNLGDDDPMHLTAKLAAPQESWMAFVLAQATTLA